MATATIPVSSFGHVLRPKRFSLSILVSRLGYRCWMIELPLHELRASIPASSPLDGIFLILNETGFLTVTFTPETDDYSHAWRAPSGHGH
jgi:hypothetical protein